MCVRACVRACVYLNGLCTIILYSDAVTDLSQEIVLFGSEVLNSLWVTLAEQLRVCGTLVKEVSTILWSAVVPSTYILYSVCIPIYKLSFYTALSV